jgi:hypothetical protein
VISVPSKAPLFRLFKIMKFSPIAFVGLLSIGFLGVRVAIAQVPDLPGWRLHWHDEFDGPQVNGQHWRLIDLKNSFNNERQHYRPEQASIVDGKLQITATNEPLDGKLYRSARLESMMKFGPGRFEARIDLPTTQGMWPAFWLLPNGTQWPTGGEIDILENRGRQPSVVSSAYHWQKDPGPCCSQHRFVFEEYSATVNGAPGGDPDGTTVFPQHMRIDYVRVWQPM